MKKKMMELFADLTRTCSISFRENFPNAKDDWLGIQLSQMCQFEVTTDMLGVEVTIWKWDRKNEIVVKIVLFC